MVGFVLLVGGAAAFWAVMVLLPSVEAVGSALAPAERQQLPENLSSEVDRVLGLGAHDLRIAALLLAACGLLLALAAPTMMRVLAGMIAAATVPALAFDVAEYPPLVDMVPTGYLVVLRGVQVLLIVAAVTAALTVGTPDRRRTIAGVAVAAVLGIAAVAGLNTFPNHGTTAVLGGVLATATLLLAWTGLRDRPGPAQLGTAAAAFLVVTFGYVFVALFMLPFSMASLLLTGTVPGVDGVPFIAAGPGMALILLGAYALGRPKVAAAAGV